MSEQKDFQAAMRLYKVETGETEIDTEKAAMWMLRKGYRFPEPPTPLELLSRKIARALRAEVRTDAVTGRPYRANHAVPIGTSKQGTLWAWIDIDEAPREPMRKALYARREQMVGDAVQLSFDADHWNAMHPNEEEIAVELDFGPDVEWRKNAPEENEGAS